MCLSRFEFLEKYGLDRYDDFELLKRGRSKLPTDHYRFVDPEFDDDVKFDRRLELAGLRHTLGCGGEDCSRASLPSPGEELRMAPENEKDPEAVAVHRRGGGLVGYIPRYFSQEVFRRMQGGARFECRVCGLTAEKECKYCIEVHVIEL